MNYQICTKTVMDNIADPDIKFDENGICNYVDEYYQRFKQRYIPDEQKEEKRIRVVSEIKAKGKGREYDCIIGVSGGVDSTYTAYLVKKLGLRPLAVHLDNGWNSELAVSNIEKTLKNLDIDLYTVVLDWEEFKDIQKAFLLASTPDAEVPTDHAIFATLYKLASKYKIKYLIMGSNIKTEGFLPLTWSYGHYDWGYIKAIHKKFGYIKKLKDYPILRLIDVFYYTYILKIKRISILDYIDFDKDAALKILKKEFEYVPYQEKHYESVYTRFYQGYIMPLKFKMDKRKTHYSTMICSHMMNRDEALELLKKDTYPSAQLKIIDKEFVLKKFGYNEAEFENIMNLPVKTFRDYPNSYKIVNFLWNLYRKVVV